MFNQKIIALLGVNPNVINFNPPPPPENNLISEDGIQLISEDGANLITE